MAQTTQPLHSVERPATRRRFLKTAVIATSIAASSSAVAGPQLMVVVTFAPADITILIRKNLGLAFRFVDGTTSRLDPTLPAVAVIGAGDGIALAIDYATTKLSVQRSVLIETTTNTKGLVQSIKTLKDSRNKKTLSLNSNHLPADQIWMRTAKFLGFALQPGGARNLGQLTRRPGDNKTTPTKR